MTPTEIRTALEAHGATKVNDLPKTVADLRDTLYDLAVATEEGAKALDELCRLASPNARLREALAEIQKPRFGLEISDSDEVTILYWSGLCSEYRAIARNAIAATQESEPQTEPSGDDVLRECLSLCATSPWKRAIRKLCRRALGEGGAK